MASLPLVSIFISSFCTLLGALPTLFIANLSHGKKDNLLAFTAGVMVAASTYSLIPSALKLSNMTVLCVGILLGALVLTLLEQTLPHSDLEHSDTMPAGAFLLFITMALHNVPEGLSVGVSFASQVEDLGPLVALAIGLQNIPEGFLLALFLITQRTGRWKAFGYTFLAGCTEFASAWIGLIFGGQIFTIVPYGLAFAAGAMLFIVYKELIPESHGHGHERSATFSFILGLLLMIILTGYLGE